MQHLPLMRCAPPSTHTVINSNYQWGDWARLDVKYICMRNKPRKKVIFVIFNLIIVPTCCLERRPEDKACLVNSSFFFPPGGEGLFFPISFLLASSLILRQLWSLCVPSLCMPSWTFTVQQRRMHYKPGLGKEKLGDKAGFSLQTILCPLLDLDH